MDTKQKKRFFTNHSKSSAMVVSLALHAILLIVALSFVAVTVVTRDDNQFEVKPVNRPKMPTKKLQVPVKMKKKKPKPRLRKQIMVKSRDNRKMPDIKMPELKGIKGGLGAMEGAGLGGAASVGFSMPEIEVFGVKSKGEKVFLALDSDAIMMRDEVGGMAAYSIIKDELQNILESLSPTTLFNLAVFDHHQTILMFPQMVPATQANTSRIKDWLAPLNKVSEGMDTKAYGTKTMGKSGTPIRDDFTIGDLQPVEWGNSARYWFTPASVAMKQQADTVFVLTGWWGVMRYAKGKTPTWTKTNRRRWEECIVEGNKKLEEESQERIAKGEAPRVIRDHHMLIREYFPSIYETIRPPEPPWYHYTSRDFAKAIQLIRKANPPKTPPKSGVAKKSKNNYSINVIFFARKDDLDAQEWEIEHFRKFASLCRGKFRLITGLEAIKSSASKK